ncbi:MAG: DUF2953 domain-containing protein [Ruminococcus sp.]|jgi:hypothetical protein
MLHIIFAILKILGILILILLSFLCLILLSLLFVPVTYRVRGQKEKEWMEGRAAVHWLFGLISVSAVYREGNALVNIRLFGVSLETYKKIGKRLRSRKKYRVKPVREEDKSSISPEVQPQPERVQQMRQKDDSTGNQGEKTEREEKEKRKNVSGLSEFLKKISEIIKKIFRIPSHIIQSIKKIQLTLRRFCDKIRQWKKFLGDENTKEAIRCLKTNAGNLIRHVMPRKVKGYVRFGFDDPALTGQTLGAVSMILPLYKSRFLVIPVFDEKILEGDVLLKGRIFGIVLLKTAWNVYRSRPVRKTIRRFQHKEA